eukprot:scaffold73035_cov68-Phaeocystis_antarctica.AAC.2
MGSLWAQDAFTVRSPRSGWALSNHEGRYRDVLDRDLGGDDGTRRICDIYTQLVRECREVLALPNACGTCDIHGRLVSNGDDEIQTSRACCAEIQAAPRRPEAERYCMQRQPQHAGHTEADGRFVERVHVGYLDLERQLEHWLIDRLLHHLGHRRGLLPFWYDDRDASRHIIHLIR